MNPALLEMVANKENTVGGETRVLDLERRKDIHLELANLLLCPSLCHTDMHIFYMAI